MQLVVHNGGVPGFRTWLAFLPSDGVGIIMLANADDGPNKFAQAPLRIIEDLLGLQYSAEAEKVASQEAIIEQEHRVDPVAEIPIFLPPANISASTQVDEAPAFEAVPLEEYAGTYTDPGYGSFALCTPSSASAYCTALLSNFTAANFTAPDALYAAWPRLWSSHMRLRRVADSEGAFMLALISLFPDGYGRDETPFAYSMMGDLEVEVRCGVEGGKVTGCGILDTLYSPRKPEIPGQSLEERADVWFMKELYA